MEISTTQFATIKYRRFWPIIVYIVMKMIMSRITFISRFFAGIRYHIYARKGVLPIPGIVVLFLVLLFTSGCSDNSPPATPSPILPTPPVEPTRLLALVSGKITIDDGCIRIIEDQLRTTFLLAFVPEYSVVIEEDQFRISEPAKEDIIIKQDQAVSLAGGILGSDKTRINIEALKNVPEHCEGEIWLAYLSETTNNDK